MDRTLTFGQEVQRRRRALDLTQRELASRVGCALVTLKRIEGDSLRPSRSMIERFAAELQVESTHRERFLRLGRRLDEAEPLETTPLDVPEPSGSPYRGLLPFQTGDAPDYFGREALTRELVARLGQSDRSSRFIAIVGPSGSGKSSLVRAGLLPALRAGAAPGSEAWEVICFIPGERPLDALEVALAGPANSHWHVDLRSDEHGLVRAADDLLRTKPTAELLIVIDQFEEVFTLERDEDSRAQLFASLLTAVSAAESRVRVVVTLRADFFSYPLSYPEVGELFQGGLFLTLPLTPDELERAIVGPAARRGVAVEPGLVATLIHAVADQPGLLPLLQYTLAELYACRHGQLIRLTDYRELGGISSMLAHKADALYEELGPEEQSATRLLFLQLVALGEGKEDTRRRVAKGVLERRIGTAVASPLDRYGCQRLLIFDRDPRSGAPTVEIAHEALLVAWPRLRVWIEDARDDLHVLHQLQRAAEDWTQQGKDARDLATGAWLARYEALATTSAVVLDPNEREFLRLSVQERERQVVAELKRQQRELALANSVARAQRRAARWLRLLALVLSVSLVLAVSLTLVVRNEREAALKNASRSEALRLAAEAVTLADRGGSAELTALLSIRSLNTETTPQGEAALDLAATLPLPEAILGEHDDLIVAVAASPNGTFALTAALDNTVRLWNLGPGGSADAILMLPTRPSALAVAPNDETFLVGYMDGTVEVRRWDEPQPRLTRQRQSGAVTLIAVAPSDRALTVSLDGSVALWDLHTGDDVLQLGPQAVPVRSAAVTSNGSGVLVGNEEGEVTLWSTQHGTRLWSTQAHSGAVNSIVVSPAGDTFLTAGADGMAQVWDLASGTVLQSVRASNQNLNVGVFLGDGARFATAGNDRAVLLWDTASGRLMARLVASVVPVLGLVALPGGTLISTSGSSVRVWNPDRLAIAPTLRGHIGAVTAVAGLPDGRRAATGGADGSVRIWDLSSGAELRRLDGHRGAVTDLAVTPDGALILSGGSDGKVITWEVATGQQRRLMRLGAEVARLVVNADGTIAAAGDTSGTGILWNVADGRLIDRLARPATPLELTISTDSRLLIIDASRLGVQVRPVEGPGAFSETLLAEPHTFAGNASSGYYLRGLQPATAAAISADRARVALAQVSGVIDLWSTDTGAYLGRLTGHIGAVQALRFSAIGGHPVLISSGDDLTARIWNLDSAEQQRLLSGHQGPVTAVAFVAARDTVLTASADGTVRQWLGSSREVLRRLCSRLARDLTASELNRYTLDSARPTCSLPTSLVNP